MKREKFLILCRVKEKGPLTPMWELTNFRVFGLLGA
jgi:hypothetical protein